LFFFLNIFLNNFIGIINWGLGMKNYDIKIEKITNSNSNTDLKNITIQIKNI
jgi:hypothetical protein